MQIPSKSNFKPSALLACLCFVIVAMHFLMHQEHADRGPHDCPACQGLAVFGLIVALVLFLGKAKQCKLGFVDSLLFHYQKPYLQNLLGRAPPLSLS